MKRFRTYFSGLEMKFTIIQRNDMFINLWTSDLKSNPGLDEREGKTKKHFEGILILEKVQSFLKTVMAEALELIVGY